MCFIGAVVCAECAGEGCTCAEVDGRAITVDDGPGMGFAGRDRAGNGRVLATGDVRADITPVEVLAGAGRGDAVARGEGRKRDEAVDGRESSGERSGVNIPGREEFVVVANVGGRFWPNAKIAAETGGAVTGAHRSCTDDRDAGREGDSPPLSLDPEARRKGSTGSTLVGESKSCSEERETGLRTLAPVTVETCGGGGGRSGSTKLWAATVGGK
jgi:hypothetical protein